MPARISSQQRIRTEAALILGTQAMTAPELVPHLADAGVTLGLHPAEHLVDVLDESGEFREL